MSKHSIPNISTFLHNVALADIHALAEFEKLFARKHGKPTMFLIVEYYFVVNGVLKSKTPVLN